MASTRKPKQGRKFRYVGATIQLDLRKAPLRTRRGHVPNPLGSAPTRGLGMLFARVAALGMGPEKVRPSRPTYPK